MGHSGSLTKAGPLRPGAALEALPIREPLRAGSEQRDVHSTTGARKDRVSSKEPQGFPEGGIADLRREILVEGMGHFGASMNTALPVTSALAPPKPSGAE